MVRRNANTYELTLPALHPYWKNQVPVCLLLPEGVTRAVWNGRPLKIQNNMITLQFPKIKMEMQDANNNPSSEERK